jgi:hypothetical protein
MSDIWGKIRTIGLIVMITCAVGCEAILLAAQQWWWAGYWGVGVIAGVAIIEVLSYMNGKKTISTRWKEWAEANPGTAYSALALMAASFLGLIVHLAVWGGMFKEKTIAKNNGINH